MTLSSRFPMAIRWCSKMFIPLAILFIFSTLSHAKTYKFDKNGRGFEYGGQQRKYGERQRNYGERQRTFSNRATSPKENPYKALGLRSSSRVTVAEIKRAYRTLAKTHHPDKGGDPEQFSRIANAYELLMDPVRRRQYDHLQQNNHGSNSNRRPSSSPAPIPVKFDFRQPNQQRQQQQQYRNRQTQEDVQREKDPQFLKLVRDMQSSVLRVTELSDMLDAGILRREDSSSSKDAQRTFFVKHFFAVFVGNKKQEQVADRDLLFPYPLGSLQSEAGPNFWSEVVATAKIRYNKPTKLTEIFKVPDVSSDMNHQFPHIVFGKAGGTKFEIFEPSAPPPDGKNGHERWRLKIQKELKSWLEKMVTFDLQITNSHFSSVKIFKVPQTFEDQSPKNTQAKLMRVLGPGKTTHLRVATSDRLMVLDARVDTYPGGTFNLFLMEGLGDRDMAGSNDPPQRPTRAYSRNPAVMLEYMVGLETSLEISEGQCYDLSLSCQSWAVKEKQCQVVPEFMHNMCRASCGLCRWDGDQRNKHGYKSTKNQQKKQSGFSSWLLKPETWMYSVKHAPLHQVPEYVRGPIQFLRFFEEDLKHVLEFRRNTLAIFFLLGATLGINFFVFPTWLQGGGLADGKDGRGYPKLSWGDLSAVTLLLITVAVWCWLIQFASPSSVTLRRQFDMFKTFINLRIAGAFSGIFATLNFLYATGVRRGLVVGIALALGVAYLQKDAYSQVIIIGYIYDTAPILALLIVLSPVIIGFALIPFIKLSWRCRDLLVLFILDMGVARAIETFSTSDKFFWKDMNHVLEMRMSAAIPFGLVGIVVGFGVPFGFFEYANRTRIPTKRNAGF